MLLAATQWLGMARLWLGQTRMARHGMARRHGTARHGTAWHGMAWRAAASGAVVHLVSRRIVCSARQDRDAVTRAVVAAAACAWLGARSVVPQPLVRSQSLRFCADYYNSARYRDRVARQRVTI